MRDFLILRAVGILIAATWTAPSEAAGPGHGATPGAHGSGGSEGNMRPGGGRAVHMGIFLPSQFQILATLFPGEPESGPAAPGMTAGALQPGGGPEHLIAGHPVGSSHPPAHTCLGAGRAGRVCDAAADGSHRRPIGPGGRCNGAAESHRQTIAAAPPGVAGRVRRCTGCPDPGCRVQDDRQVLDGETSVPQPILAINSPSRPGSGR